MSAAHYRGFGSRVDRLFASAERLAAAGRFEEAAGAYDRALAVDPDYPHLHLYKGLALAEAGAYEPALAAIERGAALAPSSAVFPMYLGCVAVDEGDLTQAAAAFARAARIDPGNRLIASYTRLTAALGGDLNALRALAQPAMIPDSFNARLLAGLANRSADPAGPAVTAEPPGGDGDARVALSGSDARLARRAERLLERKQFEQAAELLQSAASRSAALQALEARATTAAVEAVSRALAALPRPAKPDDGREKQRRDLLLRLANLRTAEPEAQAADLNRWLESFRAGRQDGAEKALLPEVLAALADAECRSGRLDRAEALVQESTRAGGSFELDWISGSIAARRGNRRLARRLFERFARAEPLLFRERVAQHVGRG